ncbi:MAG TPA: SRPBCC family protein [Streptosporangiaceae bacterium]|jgi:carbon monoxide dehydrogenase subunit G
MSAIVASTEVERPAAEVFAYATDPTRFSEWQQGVVDGHMHGPADGTGSPAVGARCLTTRRIGGTSRPSTSELVHIDAPRTWRVRGIDGPVRAAVDVAVEPVTDARSRLTISVDFTGHGIGKILVPLVIRREARKEMPANVAALKQKLEAG